MISKHVLEHLRNSGYSENVVNFLDKVPREYAQNIRNRAWGRFKQRQHRLQIERERQSEKEASERHVQEGG